MRGWKIRSLLTEYPDRLAARLCGVGTGCMAGTFLVSSLGPNLHTAGPHTLVYFALPPELVLLTVTFLTLITLPPLAFWTLLRCRARIWPVLGWTALSTAGFGAALLFLMVLSIDDFEIEDSIRGPDGRTYYFLRCPPPMNGPGEYLITRRTSQNPLFYTVVTLGSYRRGGEFEPFGPASPATRSMSRTLWRRFETNKQLWSRR